MAPIKTVETNARSKAFQHMFGADSFDCHFEFVENEATEVREIGAHRKVLSASSPVFAAMFSGNWVETTSAVVIKDASFESFDAFVKYFYQDRIDVSVDNVVDLLTLADRYDVQELAAHCESYMLEQLSADNVLKYFPVAVRFNRSDLKTKCERLFIDEPKHILESESFNDCGTATLAAFLRMVPESCDAAKVFDVCIGWAKAKCVENEKDGTNMDNLRAELGECFELTRFKDIGFEAIARRYKKYKMLFTAAERDEILEHLLANTKTRYYVQLSNQAMLKYAGVLEHRGESLVPSKIRFKFSKRVLLAGIAFAPTFKADSLDPVPFTSEIMVTRKKNQVIVSHTAYFTVDNLSFTFPQKVLIDAGQVHEIILCRILKSYCVYGYTFKTRKRGDVEIIPIKNGNDEIAEEARWNGAEIRFIAVENEEIIQ